MPRNNGIYELVPGVYGVPGQPVQSSPHNAQLNDFAATFNVPWPMALGGTGGANPATAAAALQVVSYGVTQSLSDPQKAQARENLGITPAPEPAAAFSTGDGKITLKTVADAGWVMMNDGTIGSAASGATTRANADCEALYLLLWTNISNTHAPVTGGRGGSAAADWAANKPLALTKQLGRALCIAGAGSGLTSRALGQALGAETVNADLESHFHASGGLSATGMTITVRRNFSSDGNTATVPGLDVTRREGTEDASNELWTDVAVISGGSLSGNTASAGSGGGHANMQPSSFWNVMIKL